MSAADIIDTSISMHPKRRQLTDALLDGLGGRLAAVVAHDKAASLEGNASDNEAFSDGPSDEQTGATGAVTALGAGALAAAANAEVQPRARALAVVAHEEVQANACAASLPVATAAFFVHSSRAAYRRETGNSRPRMKSEGSSSTYGSFAGWSDTW